MAQIDIFKSKFRWLSVMGVLLFVTSVVFCWQYTNFFRSVLASLTDGADAVNLVGHLDGVGAVDFTEWGANDELNGFGFDDPYNIVVHTSAHQLYVSDTGNNRVLVFNLEADNTLTDHEADYVLGQSSLTSMDFAFAHALPNNANIPSINRLNGPRGLALDENNNLLYVGDTGNRRVLVFDVASIVNGEDAVHVLGQVDFVSAESYDPPTQAGLADPRGLFFDPDNSRLFVTDAEQSRVLSFDVSTITDGEDAEYVFGQSDFVSGEAATTRAGLSQPLAVLQDNSGARLFVSDGVDYGGNFRIMVYEGSQTWTATQHPFAYDGIDYDGAYTAYVYADSNPGIVGDSIVLDENDEDISTAMDNPPQTWNLGLVTGDPGFGNHTFYFSDSIFPDSATALAWVNEAYPGFNAVMDFWVSGILTYVGGDYVASSASNGEYTPSTATIISSYQAGSAPDINSNITYVSGQNAANVLGQVDFVTRDSPGGDSSVGFCGGMAYDYENFSLYVTVPLWHRVSIFDVEEIVNNEDAVNVLGADSFDFIWPSTPTQVGLYGAEDVFFDSTANNVWVTDRTTNRVMMFHDVSGDGQAATDAVGHFRSEAVVYTVASANNGPNATGIENPGAIVVDETGHRMFVADTGNNRVLVFNLDSSNQLVDYTADYVLGQGDFISDSLSRLSGINNAPQSLAYDPVHQYLFTGTIANIDIFDVSSISNGQAPLTSLWMMGSGERFDMLYDSTDKLLFVANTTYNSVWIYDFSSGIPTAGPAHVLGQVDFAHFSSGCSATQLFSPAGLAYANRLLYVADADNNRVLVFDLSEGITDGMSATNVLGQVDLGSCEIWDLSATTLNNPQGISFDSATDRLFVTDSRTNRVVVYDVTEIVDNEPAVNVLGQGNMTGTNAAGLSVSSLYYPTDAYFVSSSEQLWVADTSNDRLMIFDAADNAIPTATTPTFASQATDGSGSVTFTTQLDDGNDENLKLKVEYSDDGGSSWYAPYLTAVTDSLETTYTYTMKRIPFAYAGHSYTAFGGGPGNGLLVFINDTGNTAVDMVAVSSNDYDISTALSDPPQTWNLALGSLGGTYITSIVDDSVFPSSTAFDSYLDSLGMGDLSVDFWADDVFVYGGGVYNYTAPVGPTLINDYQEGNPAIDIAEDEVAPSDPDLALTLGATIARTPFAYNGHDYGGPQKGLLIFVDDTGETSTDIVSVSANDYDVSASLSDPPQTWNLCLGSLGGTYITSLVDDSVFPSSTVFDNYLDSLGMGDWSVDFWADDIFVYSGGEYIYTAPSGPTVINTYQEGDPRINLALTLGYQIGSTTPIVTTSGANTLTIVWNSGSALNSSSLSGTAQSDIKIRVTPNDALIDGLIQASAAFSIDNLAPSGLTALTSSAQSLTSVTLNWTAVTETNFNHYEIWYGATQADVESRSGTASEWDNSDDIALATLATATTTTTGLTAGTTYYFKIWAIDNFGNLETVSTLTQATTGNNNAPTSTVLSATQRQAGIGLVDIRATLDDEEDNNLRLKVEYESDGDGACDGPWSSATILTSSISVTYKNDGFDPDIDNAETYQIGSNTPIITSSGENTLDFVWDSRVDLPTVSSNYCIRITANDSSADQDSPAVSSAFAVDNLAPSGLTALTSSVQSLTSVTLNWTATTETNFNHYEIWYGATQADVESRSGTASEWDNSDDIALATLATATTTITGLTADTIYYFKIWAIDNFGNLETVSTLTQATFPTGERRVVETAPIAPTISAPIVVSENSIKWLFSDNANNEIGFELRSSIGEVISKAEQTNLSYILEDNLIPNTQYRRQVYAYNAKGYSASSGLSEEVYTLAAVPSISSGGVTSPTSVSLQIADNSNPSETQYAIYESKTAKWAQADGSLDASKTYQQAVVWGPTVTISGLNSGAEYSFLVLAKNKAGLETNYSEPYLVIVNWVNAPNVALVKKVGINVADELAQTRFGLPAFASVAGDRVLKVLPLYSAISTQVIIILSIVLGIFFLGLILNATKHKGIRKVKHLKHAPAILFRDIKRVKGDQMFELLNDRQSPKEGIRFRFHHVCYRYSGVAFIGLILSVFAKVAAVLFTAVLVYGNVSVFAFSNQGGQSVKVGDVLTYEIGYSNNGGAAATDLIISDSIPAGVIYLDAKSDAYLSSGKVLKNINNLAAGAVGVMQFRVKASGAEGDTISNQATATYSQISTVVMSNTVVNSIVSENINEPIIGGPIIEEPIIEEPIIEEPIIEEPIIEEPIIEEPIIEEPIIEEPIIEEPIIVEPIIEEPIIGGEPEASEFPEAPVFVNEWEKTKQEQRLEVESETIKIVESTTMKKIIAGVVKMISSVTKVDISEVEQKVERLAMAIVKFALQTQKATIDNPVAEKINQVAREETMVALAITSVAAVAAVGAIGATGASVLTYLQFLFASPILLLARGKKQGFGIVYNSVTKQPVDLATIRVYRAETKKLVATKVTDRYGRYQFILNSGKYYLTVNHKNFKFPCTLLENIRTDGDFQNVYYGSEFELTEKKVVSQPIAMDPDRALRKNKYEIRLHLTRKAVFVMTLCGPVLAIVSFAIHPQLWIGGVVVAQVVMYGIFRRLGFGEKPKSWGSVRDGENKASLARAVVRVFDTKFNKLLETQVTDGNGRYAFLVGNQEYYIAAAKSGYFEKRTRRINLTNEKSGYLVEELALSPHHLGAEVARAQEQGEQYTLRTGLGRQEEKQVNGTQKVVRREEEKFQGDLPEINLDDMHEDFYDLDSID